MSEVVAGSVPHMPLRSHQEPTYGFYLVCGHEGCSNRTAVIAKIFDVLKAAEDEGWELAAPDAVNATDLCPEHR